MILSENLCNDSAKKLWQIVDNKIYMGVADVECQKQIYRNRGLFCYSESIGRGHKIVFDMVVGTDAAVERLAEIKKKLKGLKGVKLEVIYID